MSRSKLALVLFGLVLACNCAAPEPGGRATGSAAPGADAAEAGSNQVIETRGEVVELPDPAGPLNLIKIHHEALDDLVGPDGTVTGMDAMTMPMALADGVDLDGVEVGSKVAISLEIDWDARPGMKVTEIRLLPPETELTFGEAQPQ